MTYNEARRIVGNQGDTPLRNMIHALQLLTWLNTPEDEQRLKAAKIVLSVRHRKTKSAAFAKRHDHLN